MTRAKTLTPAQRRALEALAREPGAYLVFGTRWEGGPLGRGGYGASVASPAGHHYTAHVLQRVARTLLGLGALTLRAPDQHAEYSYVLTDKGRELLAHVGPIVQA